MDSRDEGVCPVCNGTTRVPADPNDRHRSVCAGYDEKTETHECRNCGSQYQFCKSTGRVPMDKDGKPCAHEYVGQNAGRCYTRYECVRCGDVYHIDSSD